MVAEAASFIGRRLGAVAEGVFLRRIAGFDVEGPSREDFARMAFELIPQAALAATRTNDVYLAAQYQRLRPRRGHRKALGAVKHSIICACWHMLSTGEPYNDLGGDYA